jgi:hypothetical protein
VHGIIFGLTFLKDLMRNGKVNEERWKYYPQILSAWGVASDKYKNERFVNSIKYFYNKYPDKRKSIERFLINNDKWFMGWDK